MKIWMFQSSRDPDVFAYTDDELGAVLPPSMGPWLRQEGVALPTGTGVSANDPVIRIIRTEGYILTRAEIVGGDTPPEPPVKKKTRKKNLPK